MALHKLRQTWNQYFKASTLYKIDIAVHEIDPAWPIVTPHQAQSGPSTSVPQGPAQEANQPQTAAAATTSAAAAAAANSRSSKVHVNPHFFQKNSVANGQQQLVLCLLFNNVYTSVKIFLFCVVCTLNIEKSLIKHLFIIDKVGIFF